ncbi:MAG: T9SS type A sorting domain-containing protein [Ignavibacteriaceae bacterium]
MKKTATILCGLRYCISIIIILFPFQITSQNLLNRPESIVYDSLYNRYLVSNWTNGAIVQIDSNGVQSYFVTGHGSINGIYIAENIVFAGCSTRVKGFDLVTKEIVMDLAIPGAINYNDITADNSGYIYITDFNAKEIIKVNIESHAYSTFVTGLIRNPNGILFDEPNNRLLLCSFGYNIPILAISLEDSSVSVVASTTLGQCDGFAKDEFGHYYISSWLTSSIYKFDSVFSHPPEIFYTNSGDPVDISYNSIDDILAVPLMNANAVVFLPVAPVSVDKEEGSLLQEFELNQNYPNPFNPSTKIKYSVPQLSNVLIKVYDILGNEVETLVNEEKPAGSYEVEFFAIGGSASGGDAWNLSSGIYFYKLIAGNLVVTKKMVLLK